MDNQDIRENLRETWSSVKRVGVNGKISLAFAGAVIVFTILVTALNAGLDPNKLNWYDWISKTSINVILALVMMSLGEVFYVSFSVNNETGRYKKKLGDYEAARKSIDGETHYLGQYLRMIHNSEVKHASYNYLVDHGIENPNSILLLDLEDIKYLLKPYQKTLEDRRKLTFKSYTKRQVKIIRHVLEGGVVVKRVPKAYYLDSLNSKVNKSDYVQSGNIENEKFLVKHSGRALRIISVMFSGALLATVTVNDFMKADDAQAWMNLLSRVMICISSFYAGCGNSRRVITIEMKDLVLKTTRLKEYSTFLEGHPNFFAKTDEEFDAEEEYEHSLEVTKDEKKE